MKKLKKNTPSTPIFDVRAKLWHGTVYALCPTSLTPQLYAYVDAHTGPEPTLLAALRAHVEAQHPQHHMITPWPTAQLLAFLVRLTRPRTLIEVGTFVGVQHLAMAMAMGADAHLHTIDHDTTTLAHGRPFWKQSGNTAQISVHEGDGLDQLQNCTPAAPLAISFISTPINGGTQII
ncbi:MAG: hypothetical protein H6925_04675 [Holosporaceae bacterium]|nr:MAG: hypothetical protein H6925_04675 [Holosporaceae bacterium]